MSPGEVRSAVLGFRPAYVEDWDLWCAAGPAARVSAFGLVLRKWQATRPRPMRRPRAEADHPPPFLDDLVEGAAPHLRALADFRLERPEPPRAREREAFRALWALFGKLARKGSASCVGISKAVLLLTDGRIGPAFDSHVRRTLGIGRIETANQWIRTLMAIGLDIRRFQEANGVRLAQVVPAEFAQVPMGRLYDMITGPRS
jgi:hypothetical protein